MLQTFFDYLYHQSPTGGLSLKLAGLIVGLGLLVTHLLAWFMPQQVQGYLRRFPRHLPSGVLLLTVAFIWSLFCINCMDLGELYVHRSKFLGAITLGYVAIVFFVQEFLSVRALGCFLLLLAAPVLQAAFQQPPTSRLFLPLLAYVWIIGGMFCVGMPYLLRDAIQWLLAKPARYTLATLGGVAYGTLLMVLAVMLW
jgi:hypothetical protein